MSWSQSLLDPYQTFTARYALEMLHSLGFVFDDQYVKNESLQKIMINMANRNDKCFYKMALSAHAHLQEDEPFDLTSIFNEDEFQDVLYDVLDFEEENQGKDSFLCDVNVVHITPSCKKIMPRERIQGHRAMRHRMFVDTEEFCLVYFKPDKEGQYINKHESYEKALKSGIFICNFRYLFFGASNSQLREYSYWFIKAESRNEIDEKRNKLGNFSQIVQVGKYVSRLGLWFSKSTPTGITLNYTNDFNRRVQQGDFCVTMIDDIKRNGYCFTDGNGFISKGLARSIAEKIGRRFKNIKHDIYPSAYQIRMAGCKGLVVVEPDSTLDQFYVKIRPSMKKFESNDWDLEICAVSSPVPTRLNNQVILILSDLGVPDETFLNIQSKWFNGRERPSPDCKDLLKNKLPMPVNECRYMFGCAFESALQPGQCFIRYQVVGDDGNPLKEPRFETVIGKVIVTKNPCAHAGDMLVLEAVNCPDLDSLTDVIIFSTKDERPDPNKIAGSDLDGDQYFVYWGQDLQLTRKVNSLDYQITAVNAPASTKPLDYRSVYKYCYSLLGATSYGEVFNLHSTVVDKNLEKCQQPTCQNIAVELAIMFSCAIDGAKTGYVIDRARLSQIRKLYGGQYPDFLMKTTSYESQSILGKLYRRAVEYKISNMNNIQNQRLDWYLTKPTNLQRKCIRSYAEVRSACNIDAHTIHQELQAFYGDQVPDESELQKWISIYKKKCQQTKQPDALKLQNINQVTPKNTLISLDSYISGQFNTTGMSFSLCFITTVSSGLALLLLFERYVRR